MSVNTHSNIEMARLAFSRRLLEARLPTVEIPLRLGLRKLDLDLLDDVNLVHPLGPSTDGNGWTNAHRRRRQARVISIEADLSKNEVRAVVEDMRWGGRLVTFVDMAHSKRSAANIEYGVAQVRPYFRKVYHRATWAWAPDAGDGRIVAINYNSRKITPQGLLLERASWNYLINAFFQQPLATGWTIAGAGVNGSAVELVDLASATRYIDYGDVDPEGIPLTKNACRFTAGNPQTSYQWVYQTSPSFSANTYVNVSWAYVAGVSAGQLAYVIRRTFDGKDWDESTQSWVASGFVNTAPLVVGTPTRQWTSPINVGANATALECYFGLDVGGTASRSTWLYAVQLEPSRWPTSHIYTQIGARSRQRDTYLIENAAGKRVWNRDRGFAVFKVTPEWSTSMIGATDTFEALRVVAVGSSDFISIYYDGADSKWKFKRSTGGVTATAQSNATTMTRDTELVVGVRWASVADTELVDNYGAAAAGKAWADIWVGAAGSAAQGSAQLEPPSEGTGGAVFIGGDTAAVEGAMRHIRFGQWVPDDIEMRRLMAW